MKYKKTIGVNMVSIPNQFAGIGFLAINVLKVLAPKMKDAQFILFQSKNFKSNSLNYQNVFQLKIGPRSLIKKNLWEQFLLPKFCKNYRIDVLINVHYVSLLFLKKNIRQITIIPDLTYKTFFFYRIPLKSLYINTMIFLTISKANAIIAISNYTKGEILKYYPKIKESKIKVMYLGPGNKISENAVNPEPILKFGLFPKKYFLFVGTVEPIKNLERSIQAFNIVCNLDSSIQFVIIGKRGWSDKKDKNFQKLLVLISEKKIEKRIIFTGYLSDENLSGFYQNSKALIFPSLNEGFGMPILEAMMAKTPVITSNISSMPEVAGGAACLVDPYDINSIGDGMKKILSDEVYCNELIARGIERVKKFDWNISADKLKDVIDKA